MMHGLRLMARFSVSVSAPLVLGFFLTACEEEKGPAEKAGEQLDEAVEEMGEGLEGAAQTLEDKSE